jgi:glycosyltransferase involved in cell wall biosynthesis
VRLLAVTTGLGIGGAERALLSLVQGLALSGADVRVVSLTGIGPIGREMQKSGVPVFALGPSRNPIALVAGVAKQIAAHDTALVQTWMYHANVLGGMAARLQGTRVIWGVRATDMLESASMSTRLGVWTGRASSRVLPARIIYCAHSARRLHEQQGYPSIRGLVIPNSVAFHTTLPSRAAARQAHGMSDTAVVVGRIGRWHAMKDWPTFFHAMALIRREFPNLSVLAAGPGVTMDNTALRQLLRATGMQDYTTLLGPIDDTLPFYRACDVVVSSSAWGEAFPNVLAEALAAGTPVVSSDVGDSAIIVADPERIVPPEDPTALGNSTLRLLRMPEWEREAIGRLHSHRIQATYSREAMVESYLEAYHGVLA